MLAQLKVFIFGLLVGAIVAFPLGINFGRDEPLLSNPFAKQPVKEQVVEKAEEALETAREQVHKATEPAKKKLEQQVK